MLMVMDTLMEIMGCTPILSVKVSVKNGDVECSRKRSFTSFITGDSRRYVVYWHFLLKNLVGMNVDLNVCEQG